MEISVVSDIHLEFGRNVELPGGEVLLLAGDILTAQAEKEDFEWLKRQCSRYTKAFMADGNHTFYHGDLQSTTALIGRRIMEWNIDNLAYGDAGALEYGGVKFVWATLWTDFAGGEAMAYARHRMNDYRLISCGERTAQPEDMLTIHRLHRAYIASAVQDADKVVVMTHHAPSKRSIHPRYKDDALNACYSSNLEPFIERNPQIKLWVHGHTHHSFDYKVGDCRVVCNPRGYEGYDLNPQFNPALKLEIA